MTARATWPSWPPAPPAWQRDRDTPLCGTGYNQVACPLRPEQLSHLLETEGQPLCVAGGWRDSLGLSWCSSHNPLAPPSPASPNCPGRRSKTSSTSHCDQLTGLLVKDILLRILYLDFFLPDSISVSSQESSNLYTRNDKIFHKKVCNAWQWACVPVRAHPQPTLANTISLEGKFQYFSAALRVKILSGGSFRVNNFQGCKESH